MYDIIHFLHNLVHLVSFQDNPIFSSHFIPSHFFAPVVVEVSPHSPAVPDMLVHNKRFPIFLFSCLKRVFFFGPVITFV